MKSTDLAAAYSLKIGGAQLDPELVGRLVELRVETTTALPDVCVLRLTEFSPDATGALKVIDNELFALGKPLSVAFAAAAGGSLAPVFDGEITTVEAEMGTRPGGEPILELIVTGHDRSHRMHRQTTTRTLRQMTVTDVARKMAAEHGLKVGKLAAIDNAPAEVMHQVGETDWAFLSRLVRGHGGELDVVGGGLEIIDPTQAGSSPVELTWGETLERFRPRVSSVGQVAEVTVQGWDPKKKAAITEKATPKASTTVQNGQVDTAVSGSKVLTATAQVASSGDAKAAAKGIAARLGHERVQAEAVATGDPRLLAGAFVDLKGVGTRFGGTHRIVSAVHQHGRRGYQTKLTLGAGGRPLAESMRGTAPPSFGDHLTIGLVTDNNDPEKLARVKVKYPTVDEAVESGWARIAREAAGKERGTVALPHVGDEVVVGFEHGDVRRPFVLGALFNGTDTPGADLVKTTSSVAARYPRDLDVATKEKATLAADKRIAVSSGTDGLEVTAAKDLKITATQGPVTIETNGQIKANGKQGVEVAANGPLKITSTAPVTIESNAALQLKGTAVQVQASGVLQLSGATVMLG